MNDQRTLLEMILPNKAAWAVLILVAIGIFFLMRLINPSIYEFIPGAEYSICFPADCKSGYRLTMLEFIEIILGLFVVTYVSIVRNR